MLALSWLKQQHRSADLQTVLKEKSARIHNTNYYDSFPIDSSPHAALIKVSQPAESHFNPW